MSQPLKRFTQCGSLTMLFAVFIVLFGVSSTALTTFGKSNSANQATPPPIIVKDCATHTDCSTLRGTSCVRDYPSHALKCLCGNNKPPINEYCPPTTSKALRHLCQASKECDTEMICDVDNRTRTLGNYQPTKVCLCDEEGGYHESINLNICSGSVQLLTGLLVPLLALFVGSIVARRPNNLS